MASSVLCLDDTKLCHMPVYPLQIRPRLNATVMYSYYVSFSIFFYGERSVQITAVPS